MKSNRIINILSSESYGGTFLDWSLHYLAGHEYVHSGGNAAFVSDGIVRHRELTSSPLTTNNNAHGYMKNHPIGYKETKELLRILGQINTSEFHTTYTMPCRINEGDYTISPDVDYELLLKLLSGCGKTLWVSMPPDSIYQLYTRDRRSSSRPLIPSDSDSDYDYTLNKGEITNIWDKREILALSRLPFHSLWNPPSSPSYISLPAIDLMTRFDEIVDSMFDELDIVIDERRRDKWMEVYHEWKKLHHKGIQWIYNFKGIMEFIINGDSMDISQYELDFSMEVVIQHVLIYKYGLNLKTWGLTKFPNNTKDIHVLLEPNIHPIKKYDIPNLSV